MLVCLQSAEEFDCIKQDGPEHNSIFFLIVSCLEAADGNAYKANGAAYAKLRRHTVLVRSRSTSWSDLSLVLARIQECPEYRRRFS